MYKAVLKAYVGVGVVEITNLWENSDRLAVEQYIENSHRNPEVAAAKRAQAARHRGALSVVMMIHPENTQ